MLKLLLFYSLSFAEAGNVLGQRYEKGPKVRKIRDVLDESTTILNVIIKSVEVYNSCLLTNSLIVLELVHSRLPAQALLPTSSTELRRLLVHQ